MCLKVHIFYCILVLTTSLKLGTSSSYQKEGVGIETFPFPSYQSVPNLPTSTVGVLQPPFGSGLLHPFPWGSYAPAKASESKPNHLRRRVRRSTRDGIHGSNGPTYGDGKEVLFFKVAASGLPGSDPFGGKADPFIQISYANKSSNKFDKIARTETLTNINEPIWKEVFKFEKYMRGGQQKLQFEIRDHDAHNWDDRIGFAYIDVDSCVSESRPRPRPQQPTIGFYPVPISDSKELFSKCSAQISGENGVLIMKIL